jgi:hypothetical protein
MSIGLRTVDCLVVDSFYDGKLFLHCTIWRTISDGRSSILAIIERGSYSVSFQASGTPSYLAIDKPR